MKRSKCYKINIHILNEPSHTLTNGEKRERNYLNNSWFKAEIKNHNYRLFRNYEKWEHPKEWGQSCILEANWYSQGNSLFNKQAYNLRKQLNQLEENSNKNEVLNKMLTEIFEF